MTPRPAGPAPDSRTPRLVVLQSFKSLTPSSNPYLSQLVASLPDDVVTRTFSWRFALSGRYDVFHLQWPELLVRGRDRPRTMLRLGLFAVLLVTLWLRRVAVVRTVHNVRPHDAGGRLERRLLHRLDRRTQVWVTLNDQTPVPESGRRVTIAHGHYRDHYGGFALPDPTPGRLLYFGLVRRYKGVEQLVAGFGELTGSDLTLRIVGRPDPAELGQRIEAAMRDDPRISARWTYLPDAELAREIGASQLVVLPYTEIHNSGSLLLALSLDRPVLVPAAPTTAALQREVGPDWVMLFEPPLTAADLNTALASAAARPDGAAPDLSARDWPLLGRQFARVYREAVAARGGRRRYSE